MCSPGCGSFDFGICHSGTGHFRAGRPATLGPATFRAGRPATFGPATFDPATLAQQLLRVYKRLHLAAEDSDALESRLGHAVGTKIYSERG